jgi:hypothetical protein
MKSKFKTIAFKVLRFHAKTWAVIAFLSIINFAYAETYKRPPPIPLESNELDAYVAEITECMGVFAAAVMAGYDSRIITKESFEMGRSAYEVLPVLNGFAYYSLIVGGVGRKSGSTYTDVYANEVSKVMQARANDFRKIYLDGFFSYYSQNKNVESERAKSKYIYCSKIITGKNSVRADVIFDHTKKYEIYSPK